MIHPTINHSCIYFLCNSIHLLYAKVTIYDKWISAGGNGFYLPDFNYAVDTQCLIN